MPLDLTGTRAKLAWAREHFKIVDGEITAWLKGSPHELAFQGNEQFTKYWLVVRRIGVAPDFQRWGLIIGDCVTNLRDTLDHLIFAIAGLPASPKPEKRDKAAFIITGSPAEFKKWSRGKLASVPDPIRDSVLGFQPFNRRSNPKLPSLLGILAELANSNKHKAITLVLTLPSLIDVELVTGSGILQRPTAEIHEGDVQDGTVVFMVEVPEPDPQIKLVATSYVRLHVALKHKPIEGNTSFNAASDYQCLILDIFEEIELVIDTFTKLA